MAQEQLQKPDKLWQTVGFCQNILGFVISLKKPNQCNSCNNSTQKLSYNGAYPYPLTSLMMMIMIKTIFKTLMGFLNPDFKQLPYLIKSPTKQSLLIMVIMVIIIVIMIIMFMLVISVTSILTCNRHISIFSSSKIRKEKNRNWSITHMRPQPGFRDSYIRSMTRMQFGHW